jgi:hypothetical protein
MVDFLYDFFYEVLSEEGIWVLILIGAAFAVASFILLMMKIETGPRQRRMATSGTVAETIEDPVPEKKRKLKIKKNKSKNKESTEAQDSAPAMTVRPEMVTPNEMEQDTTEPDTMEPGNMEHMDMENMDPDGFNIPALPENGDEPSPLNDTPMPSVSRGTVQDHPGTELSPEAVDTMAVEDAPATDAVETVKNEEEDDEQKEENSDGSDIFSIFTDVEEEESGISEFAKNLDDVTINGLLEETEGLSEELKNMFTKNGRA